MATLISLLRYVQENEGSDSVQRFNRFCNGLDRGEYNDVMGDVGVCNLDLETMINLVSEAEDGKHALTMLRLGKTLQEEDVRRYSRSGVDISFVRKAHAQFGDVYDRIKEFDTDMKMGAVYLMALEDVMNVKVSLEELWDDIETYLKKVGELDRPSMDVFFGLKCEMKKRIDKAHRLTEEQKEIYKTMSDNDGEASQVMIQIPEKHWKTFYELHVGGTRISVDAHETMMILIRRYEKLDPAYRSGLLERHTRFDVKTILIDGFAENPNFREIEPEWYEVAGKPLKVGKDSLDMCHFLMNFEGEKRKEVIRDVQALDHEMSYGALLERMGYFVDNPDALKVAKILVDHPFAISNLDLIYSKGFSDRLLSIEEPLIDTWLKMTEVLSYSVWKNADYRPVIEAYQLVEDKLDPRLTIAFIDGLKTNIEQGTERQWAENIIAEVKRGKIGGGNYRGIFGRYQE